MAAPAADLSGGPALLSISLATAAVALATTVVRFCTRAGITGRFAADDYTSGVAAVSSCQRCNWSGLRPNIGQIVAFVGTIFAIIESTSDNPVRALEFDLLAQPWYLMSATLSKISMCLFFMSMLGRARHWRILLGVFIFTMAAVNLAFALAVNLQCRPLEMLWRPDAEGECWSPSVQMNIGYAQGGE